ncbi:hypothetical protein RU98_GL001559 [Enterococcus caccae]|nr:hypothetical protein RU98_GL001559 [Enterococcus caccae]
MSIFTISGIFLAVPGGTFVTRFGPKKLLMGLMGCLALGNIGGAVSSSFWTLMISRAIEGISFSMIIMVGVVLINFWFKDGNSGTATGLWGTFSALGSMLAMNLFKPVAQVWGLRSLWMIIAGVSLFLLCLYFLLLDEPTSRTIAEQEKDKGSFKIAIENKSIWLLALAQGAMAFILFTFINLYPVMYTQQYGVSETVANNYTGYFGLFGIPFGAFAGYLIDKTKKGRIIIFCSFLLMLIAIFGMGYLSNEISFIVQLFALSAGASLSSSCVMILAPKVVAEERLIGASISFINLFYYIGIFIGPPIVTKVSEVSQSWVVPIYLLGGVGIIALLAVLGFIKVNTEQQ